MDDLIAFVRARLDEDEALARLAAQVAGPDWTWKTEVPDGCDEPTDYVTTPGGTLLLDTMGGIEGDAPHVARHDPARVLREVEAKREILTAYIKVGAYGLHDDAWIAFRFAIETLAATWSDHPDFRQGWKD